MFAYVCIWRVSRQLPQREPQIVLFLTHIYDTKMCFKKLFDKHFRRIFSSAFQWWSFSEIFHFHLQKLQNVLYLEKCIFNIFFYPLDRKLSIFYVEKDIFQRVPEVFSREIEYKRLFEGENVKFQKNYLHHWKAEGKIRRKHLSNNFLKYILVS